MRKMIVFGAFCFLAAVLLAQTQKKQVEQAPPPVQKANPALVPLNIKPGLWQTTMTSTVKGMPPLPPDEEAKLAQLPPEQRARFEAMLRSQFGGTPQTHTWKSCTKKEDLNKYPFDDPKDKCTYTVLGSTSSTMDVQGTCRPPDGYKYDFTVHLKAAGSEHASGTGQMVISRGSQTMTANYSGSSQWIGANCPAGAQ
ncbi:MAG TPA: DUF3617 domain-containing protein [Patescibacteria group bacterium]|nr:DUF3617 domain-containing protein [Patescibacteria group bacterium]